LTNLKAALWYILENCLYQGGSTVKELRSLVDVIELLDKADKYKTSGDDPPLKQSLLALLERMEKANPEGSATTILKPMRTAVLDPKETLEDFQKRITKSTLEEEGDRPDGVDWMKIYSLYVRAKQEGRLDELQLEVS
jgi:hypothetical protein